MTPQRRRRVPTGRPLELPFGKKTDGEAGGGRRRSSPSDVRPPRQANTLRPLPDFASSASTPDLRNRISAK